MSLFQFKPQEKLLIDVLFAQIFTPTHTNQHILNYVSCSTKIPKEVKQTTNNPSLLYCVMFVVFFSHINIFRFLVNSKYLVHSVAIVRIRGFCCYSFIVCRSKRFIEAAWIFWIR